MIKMLDMIWPKRNATYKALKEALRREDYKKFSNLSKKEREDALHIAHQVWWEYKDKDPLEKEQAFKVGEVLRRVIRNEAALDEGIAKDASAIQDGANTLEALARLLQKESPIEKTVSREAAELSEVARRMGHVNGAENYASTTSEISSDIIRFRDRSKFPESGSATTPTVS